MTERNDYRLSILIRYSVGWGLVEMGLKAALLKADRVGDGHAVRDVVVTRDDITTLGHSKTLRSSPWV